MKKTITKFFKTLLNERFASRVGGDWSACDQLRTVCLNDYLRRNYKGMNQVNLGLLQRDIAWGYMWSRFSLRSFVDLWFSRCGCVSVLRALVCVDETPPPSLPSSLSPLWAWYDPRWSSASVWRANLYPVIWKYRSELNSLSLEPESGSDRTQSWTRT